MRRLIGTRRVGHGGTLDPAATGVLVVLVGVATRLAEYLGDLPKAYDAEIRFGLRTDTLDTTGTVLAEGDASSLTEAAVEAALPTFRGEILQVPPMVSAVKVGGKRLYELARQGETVERAARPVTIYELRLTEFHPGPGAWGRLDVLCSSGTYVRTLCADLGETLRCSAAMGALRRTRIGPFRVEEAGTLEGLEQAVGDGRLDDLLLPPSAAVAHLPSVTVGPEERRRLLHGMRIERPSPPAPLPNTGRGVPDKGIGSHSPSPSIWERPGTHAVGGRVPTQWVDEGRPVRVLDGAGELLAIGRWEGGSVAPVKVLAGADADH